MKQDAEGDWADDLGTYPGFAYILGLYLLKGILWELTTLLSLMPSACGDTCGQWFASVDVKSSPNLSHCFSSGKYSL